VEAFVEKPDLAAAQGYVADGRHFWNSGMFVWRCSAILDEMRRLIPAQHGSLLEIARVWDTPQRTEAAGAVYPSLPRVSVDYAVMEKARQVRMVEMDCRWLDVGSWTALEAALPADESGNVAAAARVLHLGSGGNIVVGDDPGHLVATIGVRDLVIVHSADATLICRKEDAQATRDMVARVHQRYGDEYQ
jgi:mannose-1-phosphate guanylyltransferase